MEFLILSHVSPSLHLFPYYIFLFSRILLLGLGVLLLNYSLRVCTRLLAAMSLHLPSLLHPLTISIPLSLLASHLMCNVFTLCSLGKTLAKIGITYRLVAPFPSLQSSSSFSCVAWHPSSHLFSDVYIALLWLIVSIYRSYSLVSPPDFDKSDEVWVPSLLSLSPYTHPSLSLRIESMPAISNGLAIDQSLVVFEHSLAKNVRPFLLFPLIFDLSRIHLSTMRMIRGWKWMWTTHWEFEVMNWTSELPTASPSPLLSSLFRVSTLYVCATMWHETKTEMTQMFKSLLK